MTFEHATTAAHLPQRTLQGSMRTTELPQVADAIGHLELSTPFTTEHLTRDPEGAMYGLAHTPERFQASWLRPRTHVPGLCLTGTDVCMGGVSGG